MACVENVSAVIFDMDGTLLDSEILTAQAVEALCCESGVRDADIDCTEFDGVSWKDITQRLIEQLPQLAGKPGIPGRLHDLYQHLLKNNPPPLINKAREAVIAAHELMPTAIVSSSNRQSIEETIRRMNIAKHISFYAGADDYTLGKPAPDGYLKAAKFLNTEVSECLVFEDSVTGVQAARNAGMQVVAVTHSSNNAERVIDLADMVINDFSDLQGNFFEQVKKTEKMEH